MTKILCDKCGNEIKYREDLVVTPKGVLVGIPFRYGKYHNACYTEREKTFKGIYTMGGRPMNSRIYRTRIMLLSIISSILGIFLLYGFIDTAIRYPKLSGSVGFSIIPIALIVFAWLAVYEMRVANKYEKLLPSRK